MLEEQEHDHELTRTHHEGTQSYLAA
jgi:hypothetical protein